MVSCSDIKIISIDFFRTLIKINPGPVILWETYFKELYPCEISQKYLEKADIILERRWREAGLGNHHFKSVRMVLEETCQELFTEIGFNFDYISAADFLINQHKIHKLFEDALPFLNNAGEKYTICLSSDGDLDMLENLHEIYPFNHVFASESLKVYKLNPQFLSLVIDHYKVKPSDILHIGDSESDIIGPKQCGVLTCWLNRKNREWKHPVSPDFTVSSLTQALDILN
jgi:putative hydrolase of the HAD superfamily